MLLVALFIMATGVASASAAEFGYSLESGPITWAGLRPDGAWNTCRLGVRQSPIVVYKNTTEVVIPAYFGLAIPHVVAGGAVLENHGTTLEVPASAGSGGLSGSLKYLPDTGITRVLTQFHFHTPSEHRIDDEYFPLEMHLVFNTSDNRPAVIGVLYQLVNGLPAENDFLRNVFLNIDRATQPGAHVPVGALDTSPLVAAISRGPLYTYGGSLTTPPCTEGVRWFVLGAPQPLTVNTYNAVKAVMKFNSRYSQNAPGQINLLELARRIADGPGPHAETARVRSRLFMNIQNI